MYNELKCERIILMSLPPIITVISGTINRLPLLKRMIQSARKEARYLPIDFIIIDSNSTDGTSEWCRSQPDIHYLNTGAPKGAIRAFTDGGMLSKARYTILANDDISFRHYSILSAYRFLEDNPRVGAVAFADNRNTKNDTYVTQKHGARDAMGRQVGSTYAQVGMFRTPLMQGAGVWGADDPLFGGAGAWTYGGDDYLSSKIWEYGYLITPCPLAEITDYLHEDETRAINYKRGRADAHLYHTRFDPTGRGQGAIFGSQAHNAPYCDTTPALRILQMPDIEPAPTPQDVQMVGLTEALNDEADVLRYPYTLRAKALGVVEMQAELSMIARVFRPHVIFMQCQSTGAINAPFIQELRKHLPNTKIVNWNGDYWREKLFNPSMLDLLKECDVQLVVDYAVIDRYAKEGITARYWQVAPETPNIAPLIEDTPYYDVLFMGAGYSKARKDLIRFLHGLKAKGLKVGLYGIAFPPDIPSDGITYYDFARSQALMHNAKITIGAMEFQDTDGYVSNRLFEALQAEAVLLQQRVINANERLGIVGGLHCAFWDTLKDLEELITYYLNNRDVAKGMACRGKQFIETHHSHDVRVRELLKIIRAL